MFFRSVAQRILACHARQVPDLRGITVLLPNYHVAQPLAQALIREAQRPALLLPKMVTLNNWAQEIAVNASLISDSQRSALLYQQLRQLKWFEQADLWGMTQELLGLFDELTHALTVMPQAAASFALAVQQAYQTQQNSSLQLEARLVFELWYAMQSGVELDSARAYQQRLAQLAAQASQPLFVLRTSDWTPLEQRFLDEYAALATVQIFDIRTMQLDLPQQTPPPHFFAATSLEQEASAAAMQVRLWLNEGKRDIAIVAQDRVVARRMRALLERAEVFVTDETGWTFATLSVSTVLERWLTAVQSDFYHHDLLDLLKSPYIFADIATSERKAAVYQLEQLLREHGVVSGLEKFIALAQQAVTLHQPLARLRQAASVLGHGKKKTLADWLVALNESLRVLGVNIGLQQDDAGQQLLRALATWQQELQHDKGRYAFFEWRRWLAQQLDTQTYRDDSIDSPVRFTHLAATRWRSFDALLLLGCDADNLPSTKDSGRWFNDAVRSSLNLPTRSFHAARQHDDLHALLTLNDCVLVTWQQNKQGEVRMLSPFLQMLRDEHQAADGNDLSDTALEKYLDAEALRQVVLPPSTQPLPSVLSDAVPQSVSISAYNSLVACPYQFYARYILRLNELDEVQEGIEKRDFGERVHAILHRFHERHPQITSHSQHPSEDVGRASARDVGLKPDLHTLELALRNISEEVFADLLAQDFSARAWLLRWFSALPAYLAWQLENEKEGWRYAESESDFDWQLEGVRLRGRIDRLDVRGEEKRVLDYKTQSDTLLRNKLKEPGEDVQLACYAYAHEAADAAFVSIDNEKVKLVMPKEDVPLLAQLNAERLVNIMQALRDGAALPANGIDAVCGYCEMRGVCRKGEWQ